MSHLRAPARPEDYVCTLVRVTALEHRPRAGGKRTVFRIDEIGHDGEQIVRGLYYAYIDAFEGGARTLCRCEDDDGAIHSTLTKEGVPFPFAFSRPPALGFRMDPDLDGFVESTGLAVSYERAPPGEAGRFVVQATVADCPTAVPHLAELDFRWYGQEITEILGEDPDPHVVETQRWRRNEDWFFEEMERRDGDGVVVLRARLVRGEAK